MERKREEEWQLRERETNFGEKNLSKKPKVKSQILILGGKKLSETREEGNKFLGNFGWEK